MLSRLYRFSASCRNLKVAAFVSLGALAAIVGLSSPAAAAETFYDICITTQNREDAGTGDPIHATLYGLTAASGEIVLNQDGRRDMKTGRTTCFRESAQDIGHINALRLDLKNETDDICIHETTIARENALGGIVSTSHFWGGCIGDNNASMWLRFDASNPVKPLTASRPVGDWDNICKQFCEKEYFSGIDYSQTDTKETSSEVTKAVEESLSGGVEIGAFSAGASRTSSTARSIGQTMSREISRTSSESDTLKVPLTAEYMNAHGIRAAWQWVAKTTLSDGRVLVVRSKSYTCTPDYQKPIYLPGSPEDLAACSTPVAAAPAAQPQAAAPAQGDEAAQLAAMMGMTRDALEQFVTELQTDGYGDDAIELIVANEIAIYNNQPSLSEAEVDARLDAMGYGVAAASAPRFLGCFADAAARDLNGHNEVGSTMTASVCAGICAGKGFDFAGTQFANQCFCGNSYGKLGTTDRCTMPCAGNPNETCGGPYANSVYQIK